MDKKEEVKRTLCAAFGALKDCGYSAAEIRDVLREEFSFVLAPVEPDWSNSKTLPSESWKNPLFPMQDRLQMADGAVRFRDEVIANLRKQLAASDSSLHVKDEK